MGREVYSREAIFRAPILSLVLLLHSKFSQVSSHFIGQEEIFIFVCFVAVLD